MKIICQQKMRIIISILVIDKVLSQSQARPSKAWIQFGVDGKELANPSKTIILD